MPTKSFEYYERELQGQPPFHPRMMVALLLYCYATGTRSLLAEAESTDVSEDAAHGPDRSGEERPEELARRQSRLAKIQQAKAELEERARRDAAEEAVCRPAEGKGPPATAPADVVPEPKDQINFTDPESRIMKVSNKLRTKKGREQYAKRKGIIEPIFGQLKHVLGFRQFSLRGLAAMRSEWRLMCTVHNLLKLWRHNQVPVAG